MQEIFLKEMEDGNAPITLQELLNLIPTLQNKYGKNAVLRFNAGYNNVSVLITPEEPKVKSNTVRLFKVSVNNPETDLYAYSTDEDEVLEAFDCQDSGGMPHKDFANTLQNGEITEIKSLKEISKKYQNWCPYSSQDVGDEYQGMNVKEFFKRTK